ncbi:hypothetical protein EMIHUDRAFT_106730 [Emiliania huxleyi CCMP1516]|uniref:Uncharacterized protein n=2 Tax=Emiliania huxleyi TaxID=2903 RepID=A0A0D3I6B5_EMIH1|nr:hypothetical protein EMIHUDRAFT_106730 [Emiliania huxleyi CCMP1516]EOD06800.1 hypothetical protein EMIHUDRAFT_106730 [Emiliania huxleyi CCMP1516]|eukprot:XP_005759229.1 hypothetical protein EMIHUDRAFT_106730 [Emiliania huxleyi CCMP1516]
MPPPPWLQRCGLKLLPVAGFYKICRDAEHQYDTANQLGESLVAMLRNPRNWLRDLTYPEHAEGLAASYLEENGSRFARFALDYESESFNLLENPALLDVFVDQMTQIFTHILKTYRDARDIVHAVDTRFFRALHAEAAYILDDYEPFWVNDDDDDDDASLLNNIERDYEGLGEFGSGSRFLLEQIAMGRSLESRVSRYHVVTLWQGMLAYQRCKDPLLRWLERAQHRLGAYEEGGVARQRDLESYEADNMDEA